MEKIFIVTVLQDERSANYKSCVGWFKDFEEASTTVKLNCGDIHEGNHKWAVIEESVPGLYTSFMNLESWFIWDENFQQYASCPKPIEFDSICGFGVG